MSLSKVQKISLKYQIVTVALAVGSAIVLFVPHKYFKPFKTASSYVMSASILAFITTRHSMRDVLDEVANMEVLEGEKIVKLEKKIDTITEEKSDLQIKIESLNGEIDTLKFDASEQLLELQTCQQVLKETLLFNTESAHKIVEECYRVAMRKVVCHIDALHRNYPDCASELDKLKIEIEKQKLRMIGKLENYTTIYSFDLLIDTGLELQEFIICKCIELRCMAQAIIIGHLSGIAEDAVPLPQFEKNITELSDLAHKQIAETKEKRKVDLKAMAEEFTTLVDGHKQRYSADVNESIATAKLAMQQLEVSRYELQDALERLEETKKPLYFSGGSSFAMMANSVADYYYNRYRFLLDALHWEETDIGFKVIYSLRRNPGLIESEIEGDNSLQQCAAFTNALYGTEPKWEFNRQFSQLSLTVTHRRIVKLKNELPRGVKTADKFVATVKNWRRVRITGGSESGKSPTAENVICAILSQTKGECDFYDPMFDSVKNHRTIPAVGHTHSDSIKGLKEYQARMETQPSDALYLAWFDEIDTTLDENPKSASDLKAILKQSSHKNSGLIITGQNANVRNLKGGFDRSDMNNFVCCHIGDNYRDAIANSHLSEAEKSGLMKTGDALTDWCVLKNCEDNLDNSDTAAYRYALVIEPNKKPFFMILPEFGEYVWQAQTEAINSTSETNTIDSDTVTVSINPRNCPRCDTASKRNGYVKNVTPRVQRYKCKNDECNHEFS